MADFYISGVKFSPHGNFISQVKVRKKSGNQVGPELVVDREFVAQLLTVTNLKFKTCIRGVAGWIPGADIQVARGIYLISDPNAPAKVNLHNLPKFE